MVLGVFEWREDVYWVAVSDPSKSNCGREGNGMLTERCSLAMAEMTTFATAVYRKYRTELGEGFADVAPGVTSRFEVFHDDTLENVAVS